MNVFEHLKTEYNLETNIKGIEYINTLETVVQSHIKEIKRYEKALCALLKLSCDTEQDILIDIISDALTGHELPDQYKEDYLEGTNILAQYLD